MPEAACADAPGRVNLIGEHTDYHDGYVLPTVIPQRTRVELRRRADRGVRVASVPLGGHWEQYEIGAEAAGRGWVDYVQGVTAALTARGVAVPGFDAHIRSDVPIGAGVSSSAALEVSLLRALRILLSLDLDDVAIARIAHEAETGLVGAPVGIMDQMASSLGRDGEALFLDTRTLAIERLPLPASLAIVVIDSGIAHAHATGAYATRRRESFEAAALLGVERLRDIGPDQLAAVNALPPGLARRARHVITENARVLASVDAIRAGDARRLGELFAASHASMRDDYEISTAEVDVLVAIAYAHDAVYGARMTGGGFGGAVVVLVRGEAAAATARQICEEYERQTGRQGAVLVPSTGGADARA